MTKKLSPLLLAVALLVGLASPVVAYQIVDLASNQVSGKLPVSKGGTGQSALAAGVVKSDGGAGVYSGAVTNSDVDPAAGIVFSKLGAAGGAESLGAQSFATTVDSKGTLTDVEPHHLITSDGGANVLDSWTIATNAVENVATQCSAVNSTHDAGAAYCRQASFLNNDGGVVQIGTTQDCGSLESVSAWDVTIDNSGATVRVKVTGDTTTIAWSCVSSRVEVVP
jgi:hypothetical protein